MKRMSSPPLLGSNGRMPSTHTAPAMCNVLPTNPTVVVLFGVRAPMAYPSPLARVGGLAWKVSRTFQPGWLVSPSSLSPIF